MTVTYSTNGTADAWYTWNNDATDRYCYDVWTSWSTSTCTVSNHGTASTTTWITWNHQYDTWEESIETSDGTTWVTWIESHENSITGVTEYIKTSIDKLKKWKPPSTEQLRANKAQQEIRRIWNQILSDEAIQEKEEAENVALELLLDLISEEEHKRYKETGLLFVSGKKFDYVLKKGGGVHRIEKGKVIDFAKKKEAKGKYICVHPKNAYSFPETDNVIALKTWIEGDEDEFLKIGNSHHTEEIIKNFDKVVGL